MSLPAHKTENVIRTKNVSFNPVPFNGKEKDEETGYGYFGARYMDHELMNSFISVDRYASKYPFITPYAYCAWNPIIFSDPNGDTVVLSGDAKLITKALSQIRERSGNLYYSIDDGGRLKARQRVNKELSPAGATEKKDIYVPPLRGSKIWMRSNPWAPFAQGSARNATGISLAHG